MGDMFKARVENGGVDVSGYDDIANQTHLVTNFATNKYYQKLLSLGVSPSQAYSTLASAYNALSDQRNDLLSVHPGSYSLGTTLAIAKNLVRLKGTHIGPMMNQRARIGMSTTFTPMVTVSGYGNTFENLYSMHGTAVGDAVGWLISGERNAFLRVAFGGPMNAAQAGDAAYEGVRVNGTECFFDECVFGTQTMPRDEVSPNLVVGAGTHTKIRNSAFHAMLTDTDPVFVKVENTSGVTQIDFENCLFSAMSVNMAVKAAVAFVFTGGATCVITIDKNTRFVNVSNLAVTGSMKYIWTPTSWNATADELNLISINSATF